MDSSSYTRSGRTNVMSLRRANRRTAWDRLFVLLLGATAYRTVRDRLAPDLGTSEHARHLYTTGEIDLDELERRLDVLEDPEADRIRSACERVPGISEDTSFAIAAEFDTLDELRDASRGRLEQIPNVGEERAQALQDHL